MRILAAVDKVAARHDAVPAQIALAWLIAKPVITAPIVSATSLRQLGEIMKAPQIKLAREDIAVARRGGSLSTQRRLRLQCYLSGFVFKYVPPAVFEK